MEVITALLLCIIMMFMGFLLGICVRVQTSEEEISDAFEKGYFMGYENGFKN